MIATLIIVGIMTYTKKMSIGIALFGMICGFVLAYIFAPYTEIVMNPIANYLQYNYSLTLIVILGIGHLISSMYLCGVAFYNLIVSDGEISWA